MHVMRFHYSELGQTSYEGESSFFADTSCITEGDTSYTTEGDTSQFTEGDTSCFTDRETSCVTEGDTSYLTEGDTSQFTEGDTTEVTESEGDTSVNTLDGTRWVCEDCSAENDEDEQMVECKHCHSTRKGG